MTINELEVYFNQKWNRKEFYGTVTKLSKSDNGNSLVKSSYKMFNFDTITRSLYKSEEPSSVDGVYFANGNIHLVEFKTGFYQKIRKGRPDFDEEIAKCSYIDSICNDYWEQFTQRQDKEFEILLDSLKLKALETYLLLEKQIGFTKKQSDSGKVILQIVIDDNGIDGMFSELSDLANVTDSKSKVQNSMHRFKKLKDLNNDVYYYDEIDVYSGKVFPNILNSILTN